MGVRLRVVRMDLEHGAELVPGAPPMVVLREHLRGGIVDTRQNPPRIVGPSSSPVIWHCSEDAEAILLDEGGDVLREFVYGSEGSGKTTLGAQWLALRLIEMTGRSIEAGVTAPTKPRLDHAYQAIIDLWPASWYHYVSSQGLFRLANGARARLVSTHRQSADEGSRVQGYNWAIHLGDEMQDQLAADADIEMRGRTAARGKYRRLCTCTAKDHPAWRQFRDERIASGMWKLRRLLGTNSPFVWPKFWEDKKKTLSKRDFQRRVLAMDVGPERQLFNSWDHDLNLRPAPQGSVDVTERVLARFGGGHSMLLGVDPGKVCQATEFLRAYQFPREPIHRWFVVDEVVTETSIIQVHVQEVLRRLRERWYCNEVDRKGKPAGPQAIAFADPYTDAGNDASRPHLSVYKQFAQAKIRILPAATKTRATNTGLVSGVAQIPLEARIDMTNRLLCAYDESRRLFVALNEHHQPAAPKLVFAFESLERGLDGSAEPGRKGAGDMTHFPAAVGYALWGLEQPRVSA